MRIPSRESNPRGLVCGSESERHGDSAAVGARIRVLIDADAAVDGMCRRREEPDARAADGGRRTGTIAPYSSTPGGRVEVVHELGSAAHHLATGERAAA